MGDRADILREELAAGRASVTSRDNSGNTLLSFAAAASCAGVVRLLLDAGAEVDARNNRGVTPLMRIGEVPKDSSAETARLLIAAGADVLAKDNDGHSQRDDEQLRLFLVCSGDT